MKKISLFIAATIFLLCFTGCSSKNIYNQNNAISGASQNASAIINVGSWTGPSSSVSSENGLYELIAYRPGSWNLLYSDYATKKQVFLCNRPECRHNNTTCAAYFETGMGLLYAGGKIILVQTDGSAGTPPHIEVMESNGTSRKELAKFNANSRISGKMFSDEKLLFFSLLTIDDDGYVEKDLISLDINSGETAKLKSLEGEGHELSGAVENQLVLNKHNAYDMIETPDGLIGVDEVKHTATLYNPYTGKESGTVYTRKDSEAISQMFNDGHMYELNYLTNEFNRYDLLNGTVVRVKNLPENSNASLAGLVYVTKEGILISDLYYSDNSVKRIIVDFDSGTLSESKLFSSGMKITPLYIMGETADSFIVQLKYSEIDFVDEAPDGSLYNSSTAIPVNAMIAKKDFFANKNKFVEIKQ